MPITPKWKSQDGESRCHLSIEYSLNLRDLAMLMVQSWYEYLPTDVDEDKVDRAPIPMYDYGSQGPKRKTGEFPLALPTMKVQVKKQVRDHLHNYGLRGKSATDPPPSAYPRMAERIAKLWPEYADDLDDMYAHEDDLTPQ